MSTAIPDRLSAPVSDRRPPLFYARVAGFIYLLAMALGIFSQAYVLGRLVGDDAAGTAQQIAASEGLFRLGIVIDVLTAVTDVVIAWAFYELLKAVDASLALVAAWLRVADAAIPVPLGLWFLIRGVRVNGDRSG
jgi:F0F1-type ATP synthase membrane subunit c/vacuolar-type H+-ATPase subunit K